VIDSPKYGLKYAKVDLEDLDKCKQYRWFVDKCNKQNYECFYAGTFIYNDDGKRYHLLMHRCVMDATSEYFVDHHNRDSLDNRKFNLRACDDSTNSMNSKLYRTNTSGHKGVCWSTKDNKWMAYIMIKQKHKTLGYFNNFDDAVICREKAEKEYFGEFNAIL